MTQVLRNTSSTPAPDLDPGLPRPTPFRRALVIANPVSGRQRGGSVGEEVSEGLRRHGISVELHLTRGPFDATEQVRARDPETDLIISVGGDGTLSQVLAGLDDDRVAIGVLPLGTGNVLCHDLGLPREVDRALEVFAAGQTTEVDVALVDDKICFLVAGIGPDAMVVEEVHRRRKGPISQWAYLPAAVRVFFRYRPTPLTVELDGERLEGTYCQVLACNLVHYGGLVRLSARRILGDGRYEVFLFRRSSKWAQLMYVLQVLLRLVPGGSCEMRRARRVRVTSERPMAVQIDGDPAGATPIELEVTNRRFRLLVP